MAQTDAHGCRIETWVFDLDNTLYAPSARLFDQIDRRMTAFIMRELALAEADADVLRTRYWQSHGATLAGLMENHGVDPHHFLEEVHDIDLRALGPDPVLTAAIRALPGRRIVHTNGSRGHAARLLSVLGLDDVFEAVFAIEDKDLIPKPRPEAHDRVIAAAGIDPRRAAMIEDDQRNLVVPKARGMATVWLSHDPSEPSGPHVDHRTRSLHQFLTSVL